MRIEIRQVGVDFHMKRIILAAAIALAASGAAASAQDNDEAAQKEKTICKTQKVTGSRTQVRRVCMTQAQWDEQRRNTKRGLDDMTRNASGGRGSSNNGGLGS